MFFEDTRHSSRIQPDHWDIALPAPVCVCEVDPPCETLKVNGQSLGHSFALQGDHLSRARERGAKNRFVRFGFCSEGEWVIIGGFGVEFDRLLTDETCFFEQKTFESFDLNAKKMSKMSG